MAGPATYPQHEKLHAVKEDTQTIGYFLEWFFTEYDIYPKGTVDRVIQMAEFEDALLALIGSDSEVQVPLRVLGSDLEFNQILARWARIDYDELMAEKEAMYQAVRANAEEAAL